MSTLEAIVHAGEILTGRGIAQKDGVRPKDEDMGPISDGAIVYSVKKLKNKKIRQKIVWIGKTSELPKKYLKVKKENLKNTQIITPGLIDCHTHLVFAGNRSEEFALRCAGVSYEEIAKKGGGILTTVHATRKASENELLKLAEARVEETVSFGVKTIEVKSGYGLDFDSEIKTLKVVEKLKKKFPHITFKSTFLGAHAFPKDISREEYVHTILNQMLPAVKKQNLAEFCDVFIDQGYYTIQEARTILSRAKDLGLKLKIHGDELYNTESAALAAELDAVSVDHLLNISEIGIRKLSQSKTVAVLLPGTAFYLKAAYAPARKLIDSGVRVAVSTDFNPGSCMCLSLPTMMTLSALYMGMSRAEIFAAVTYNAARALCLEDKKGSLDVGKDADFSTFPIKKFEEMYYRFAWSTL